MFDGKYMYNFCIVLKVYYILNCVIDSVVIVI